jgi:alkanesulfonate monooxygenase SsuD/methylene tetrahydromethanopterin reductase-like flavin-dependent oxidoreductase (luciferase family)
MDIGIGLPNTVLGVDRRGIVDWSRRAEEAGFASLGTIDRIAYDNYESLTTLAVAAGVTDTIRLTTDILIAPLRPAAFLAKQAATVNSISEGRLVLGLAVGGREDDRPSLIIGGTADVAYRRAAKYGDGWTQGGGAPDAHREGREKVENAFREAGRDDRPRTLALFYFSLGDNAEEDARRSLGNYYAFLGEYADQIVASAAKDADTVKQYVSAFEEAGADEVICFPSSADPKQVELLAEATG